MEDIYFYGFSAAYVFVIFLGLMVLKPKASDEDFFLTRRWMLICTSCHSRYYLGYCGMGCKTTWLNLQPTAMTNRGTKINHQPNILHSELDFRPVQIITGHVIYNSPYKYWPDENGPSHLISSQSNQLFLFLGMTMEDIRALEDKTKEELEKQRSSGEVRGTKPI